jgi:hypothetical protein
MDEDDSSAASARRGHTDRHDHRRLRSIRCALVTRRIFSGLQSGQIRERQVGSHRSPALTARGWAAAQLPETIEQLLTGERVESAIPLGRYPSRRAYRHTVAYRVEAEDACPSRSRMKKPEQQADRHALARAVGPQKPEELRPREQRCRAIRAPGPVSSLHQIGSAAIRPGRSCGRNTWSDRPSRLRALAFLSTAFDFWCLWPVSSLDSGREKGADGDAGPESPGIQPCRS